MSFPLRRIPPPSTGPPANTARGIRAREGITGVDCTQASIASVGGDLLTVRRGLKKAESELNQATERKLKDVQIA